MSFNVISFIKSALANKGAVPVADDNPLPVGQYLGGAVLSGSNPMPVAQYLGGVLISGTNPMPVGISNSYNRALNSVNAIKTGAGTLAGMTVAAAGTAITVNFYDSLTGTGTVIFGPYVLVAGADLTFGGGVAFATGLSVTFSAVTGTPCITVAYR